jgi:PAS domain S-box-containing protein
VGVRAAGAGADAAERAARDREPPPAAPTAARVLTADELANASPLAGAGAALWAPLRSRGRITGALLLAARDRDRLGRNDLEFTAALGAAVGTALDDARLLPAERGIEQLIGQLGDAVTVRDASGRFVMVNDAAVRLLGAASAEELLAQRPEAFSERFSLYDADGRPLPEDAVIWAHGETPRPGGARLLRRVDRRTGEQLWLATKASVLRDASDRPELVMHVTEDVTAQSRAERGQRLLVEAGRRLSAATDVDGTLQEIAELVVPALADWCVVDLPGPGGHMELRALANLDPGKVALGRRLRERFPIHLDDDAVVPAVMRGGEPVRVAGIEPRGIRAAATDGEEVDMIRALEISALLIVPISAGDEVLGVLTFVASQPHRRFDDADQDVAEALARRIGDAIRNARLLRDRAEIAHVLAAGLRPDDSPRVPGCEVAALYRPAGGDIEAGGDFYEIVDAPAGATVVMGDVVGKGAPAAALSAISRVTMRTAGRLTAEPRAALEELNHVLRRRGGMSLCTVVAVALPTELPGTAQVLLAGHPPALLLRAGSVSEVGRPGPILGAVEVPEFDPVAVELAPGDVLILYTDGVLDSVLPGGERFGAARLAALVERAGDDVGAIVRMLEQELAGLRLRDDVALLAIRCPGVAPLLANGEAATAGARLELRVPGGVRAPGEARRRFAAAFADRMSEQLLSDALIVVSELVTNAIRHGGARTEADHVGVDAAIAGGRLRIEVTDPGPGFEPGGHGPRPDGGYGLSLLDRLATGWGVSGSEPVTVWVEFEREGRL